MLGSITPLGERARGSRWGLTVTFFVVGSGAAGLALGGTLGWLGSLAGSPALLSGARALAALAGVVMVGLALDLRLFGAGLPTLERQVNEEWLYRYRGWVYGLGFGAQLGVGVVTIATTSAVYATFMAAFLSGAAQRGALVGGAFGLVRALPLLAAAGVRTNRSLLEMDAALRRWNPTSRRATLAAQLALAAAAATIAVAAS